MNYIERKFAVLLVMLTPMTCEGYAFDNHYNGKRLYYYRDALGHRWLKYGKYSFFKIPLQFDSD